MRRSGIDVSVFDGDVDIRRWKSEHGIWSVIVRCGGSDDPTYGRYTCPRFEQNYLKAKANDLHVGVYYLSDAITAEEGKADAEHCIRILKGHVLDMPVYMDVEVQRQINAGARAVTDAIKAFCDTIRAAGYLAGVYTFASMWRNNMYPDELRQYELWIAQWQQAWPDAFPSIGGWQQGVKHLASGRVLYDDPNDAAYQDYDWWQKDYPNMIFGTPNMERRNRVVERQRSKVGADYCSMNYDERDGWGGIGTHVIGLGWGCAQLCSMSYNLELGTAYRGSCYDFAGDALCQDVNQGGGQFVFVDEPLRGDLVIYVAKGYNGLDYDDYGHIAMYVGDGKVIGAWGVGRPGEPGYKPMLGVAETTIEAQSLGNGWRYLRSTLIDKPEKRKEEPKVMPKQPESKPKNDIGIYYRAHVENGGWLKAVHDGMVAGTTGQKLRLEALKITPPAGVVLEAYAHVQGIGTLYYDGIKRGKSSGEGSSANDPIIGTKGVSRRMEAIRLVQTKPLKGRKLYYRGHVEGTGWTKVCHEGEWCGTRGKSKRLEAIQIWYE